MTFDITQILQHGSTPVTLSILCVFVYQIKVEVKKLTTTSEETKEKIQKIEKEYVQKIECEKEVLDQKTKTRNLFEKFEDISGKICFIKGKLEQG